MNELIKVNYESEQPTVSGRELHKFLEVSTAYKDWFPRMCEYGFTEGTDFCSFLSESTGGRPAQEHVLTIPMAKEICMLQRNDKGKQARQYFLAVEAAWNSPQKVMARALEISRKIIADLSPKAACWERVQAAVTSILIGTFAKILCQNGKDTGEKRLYAELRETGYLCANGERYNMPTQRAMDLGLFEIEERAIQTGRDTIIARTPKITPKGQEYFLKRFLKEVNA